MARRFGTASTEHGPSHHCATIRLCSAVLSNGRATATLLDVSAEQPLVGKAWSDAWKSAHRDPRAEMLCSAHEGTLLIEIYADRPLWLLALRELLDRGLIEFYNESTSVEVDPHGLRRRSQDLVDASEAVAALEDQATWLPDEQRPLDVGFRTTPTGEQAVAQEAYHFVGGRFVEYQP